MTPRTFIVPGKPSPKARARVVDGHAFTPKPTQTAEGKVLECYLASCRGEPVIEGPVRIEVRAAFEIPRSWSKKKRERPPRHTSRPDLDNIVKLVTDALNGVAWRDDSQVCEVVADKLYAPAPSLCVTIEEIES